MGVLIKGRIIGVFTAFFASLLFASFTFAGSVGAVNYNGYDKIATICGTGYTLLGQYPLKKSDGTVYATLFVGYKGGNNCAYVYKAQFLVCRPHGMCVAIGKDMTTSAFQDADPGRLLNASYSVWGIFQGCVHADGIPMAGNGINNGGPALTTDNRTAWWNYNTYAGPVYVNAPSTCIDISGGINTYADSNTAYRMINSYRRGSLYCG